MKNLFTKSKSFRLKKNGLIRKYALAITTGLFLMGSEATAQSNKFGTSFSQFANQPGSEEWIPSALIPNNSQYYEGTSTLQRLVLVNIKPKAGPAIDQNKHELFFQVLATKQGINAYDFVTSFDQALKDYSNITNGEIQGNGFDPLDAADRLALVTGTKIPNPATATMIGTLFTSGVNARAAVPASNLYGTKQSIIEGYDAASYPVFSGVLAAARRGPQLYANAGSTISNAAMEFLGYSAPDLSGDSYGLYKIKWESASDKILILMAGHLATSDNSSAYQALWHGLQKGASFISGGPYHFKLSNLDGITIGSQDNQIQSGAIEVFPINACAIVPTDDVCENVTTTHTATTDVTGASFLWEILNTSTSNATFSDLSTSSGPTVSATMSSDIDVIAGGAGYYDLRVTITKTGYIMKQCSIRVNVNEKPVQPEVTVEDASLCGRATAKLTVDSPLGAQYEYSIDGGSNFQSSPIFDNLAAGSGYNVVVRVVGSTTCYSDARTCPTAERRAAPTKPQQSSVKADAKTLDKDLTAYPVPFSENVTVEFKASKAENYVINLYDLQGHLVRELKAGNAKAGEVIKVEVSGSGMAESMYLVRKVSKSGISTVKLLKKE